MSDVHYNAFISYRHTPRDIEVAKEIQHSLERFKIPKAIQEKYHISKIDRVFRDQEELELNSDLAQKIEDALEASDYLIVICSPQYNESKWCLMEIDTFIKKHDRDHILCVLSEGEPPSIFPEQLLHYTRTVTDKEGKKKTEKVNAEPLACDYRGDFKDANRIELPRLVSAMIGCNYDELILRQEKYRRRRLFTILGSAAAAATIAIAYLLWSNAQISRNYRQALINESKVLAKEALEYYDGQDRLMALQSALKALPDEDNDRPVIDDAVYALSKASYAYAVPYNVEESWRIDVVNNITEYFVTRSNKYIVFIDKSGLIHTYDLQSREEIASFRASSIPADIHEGKSGEVIADLTSQLESYDYLEGKKIWSVPLKYQTLSRSHLSYSKEYIGASDSFAMQIVDTEGNYYLSMPLPEEESGYITDFCWSEDDRFIALKMRESFGDEKCGIFDFETSKYYGIQDSFTEIIHYSIDKNGILYIVDNPNPYSTYKIDGFEAVSNNTYKLSAYDLNGKLFETDIDNSFAVNEVGVYTRSDARICVTLGNGIYLIDGSGKINETYHLSSSISKIINMSDDSLIMICDNGYEGTFWFDDGQAALNRSFPAGISDIQKILDRHSTLYCDYAILYEGNVYIYEYLYDDSLEYLDGNAYPYPPVEYITDNDTIVFKNEYLIGIADVSEKRVKKEYVYDQDAYYHLLDIIDGEVFVLKASGDEGALSLVEMDSVSGKIVKETDLGSFDFCVGSGFFSYPLSRSEMIYVDNFYLAPSSFICQNHVLYYHDLDNPDLIYIYDLVSGEQKTFTADLGPIFMVNHNGSYYYPAEMVVSADGRYIFSCGYSFAKDNSEKSRKAILLDLESGSSTIFERDMAEGFVAALGDGKVMYSSEDSLNICSTDGTLLSEIPYTGEQVTSFAYHDGKLYCVYPDDSLRIYKDSEEIRSVTLSSPETTYVSAKMFRFEFYDDELFVYNDTLLNIISLDSDSLKALTGIEQNVMNYLPQQRKFIVYAYGDDKLDMNFRLAMFERYTIEELIERANRQLENYQ